MKPNYCIISITIVLLMFVNSALAADGTKEQNKIMLKQDTHIKKKHPNGVIANYNTNPYIIGEGDLLSLTVWKDPALSRQVVVLPDGTISLPLIGQIVAAGRTVGNLEDDIILSIKRYLPEPVLDITVVQTNSMLVYVIGKVQAPGRYPVQTNVSVLQALAIAGGLAKYADSDDIKIYREGNEQTLIFSFDYDEISDGDKLEQNIQLQRGDVVFVP